MRTGTIVLLVVLVILIAGMIALYFLGKRMEKKQAAQKEQMDAVAQTVTMMVIDKKKMRLKDAGFPAIVVESTPKYLRRSKVPVVKAKIGPQIVSLMCDAQVFPLIPVGGKPVKAVLSGIYITGVKGIRGSLEKPQPKKKFMDRFKKDKNDSNGKNDGKNKNNGKSKNNSKGKK